jgi:hypothetical protein
MQAPVHNHHMASACQSYTLPHTHTRSVLRVSLPQAEPCAVNTQAEDMAGASATPQLQIVVHKVHVRCPLMGDQKRGGQSAVQINRLSCLSSFQVLSGGVSPVFGLVPSLSVGAAGTGVSTLGFSVWHCSSLPVLDAVSV